MLNSLRMLTIATLALIFGLSLAGMALANHGGSHSGGGGGGGEGKTTLSDLNCDPGDFVQFDSQTGEWVCLNVGQLQLVLNLAKHVFVTSQTYDGDLGGIDGADEKCQSRANAANLPGSYRAWISDGFGEGHSPISRFNEAVVPYILVNGDIVASNSIDLFNPVSELTNPIDVDEFGNLVVDDDFVWTNVGANGDAATESTDCQDWESNLDFNIGAFGSAIDIDFAWTSFGTIACDASQRLYCFEMLRD